MSLKEFATTEVRLPAWALALIFWAVGLLNWGVYALVYGIGP